MRQLTAEEFNKEEIFIIDEPCFVNGKPKKEGDEVKLSGNDKVQLMGTNKAHKKEEKKK